MQLPLVTSQWEVPLREPGEAASHTGNHQPYGLTVRAGEANLTSVYPIRHRNVIEMIIAVPIKPCDLL